ncbi:MAG: urease accessory protein [Pseudomonadota bacterium]
MSTILLFGFLIGLRHALEADHVAAVTTLSLRCKSLTQALRLGAVWGLGHSIMLFAVGAVVLSLDQVVPERLAAGLEAVVGVVLVLLGLDVLRRLIRDRIHFHPHSHGETTHLHAHSHAQDRKASAKDQSVPATAHSDSPHSHEHAPPLTWRALLVGMTHGLAGSAALVVLTLGTVQSFWLGLLYLALFGLGSMLGMAVLSCALAWPLQLMARQLTWAYNTLSALLGLVTVGLGGWVFATATGIVT